MTTPDPDLLAAPVLHALTGPHAAFALTSGRARRYDPAVTPFGALPPDPTPQDWSDLASLVADHDVVVLLDPPPLPPGWLAVREFDAVQMVRLRPVATPAPRGARPTDHLHDLTTTDTADTTDALDLARRTEPGPFTARTMELGRYLGVRDTTRPDHPLVAMAGERMHLPGWTEVSAVCTDPDHRGRGLAARLVAAVAEGIEARGERALLHVMAANTGARRVYEGLGFTDHRPVAIRALRPPR